MYFITCFACLGRQGAAVARTVTEDTAEGANYLLSLADYPYLKITEWGTADVGGEDSSYGMSGSPTKVKKVENIVFQAKEAKKLTASEEDIDSLISELLANHTIG